MGFEGQQFGSYRVIRRDGFTDGYEGEHIALKTKVYIKILSIAQSTPAEQFLAEARLIARLRHPNIIQILDFGINNTTPFIVSEYAKGTLLDRHQRGSQLPLSTLVPYVKQTANALQYAHSQGIVHRDVKPSNLFIGQNDDIKLGDWGIAIDIHDTKEQNVAGTAFYMAPEQCLGKAQPASDQYALGIVVYEWLSGQPPFSEGDFVQIAYQHLHEPLPSLRAKNPSVPQAVEDVVMKALAKKPEDRFESVQAFADALEKVANSNTGVTAAPDTRYAIGQQFGAYRLTRLLGRNGVEELYIAHHVQQGGEALMKLLPEDIYTQEDFQAGAKKLMTLRHTNMLNILDSGNTEQYLFLATAIPPEMTFAQKYPTGTALPTQAFLRYMKQLTAVLQYVHDQQVVHGHLSPEYIFVKQDDTLILSGFDEAIKTIVDADYDPPFHFEYMAPERFQGKALAASDQYALGVLAYEWLCGELPFKQTGNNISSLLMQHMQVTPPSLRAKNPALAPAIEDVVMQALAKDPAQRFASIQAFAKALEQAFQPPAFRPHEMLNQQFGAYRLVSYLGSGNLGYVYLAEHISLNSKVVVKILKEPMDTGYFRSRIRRIARLSHPNIVRVIDSGIHNDLPFLIMDYAPHGTLRERHAQQQLPLALVVEYVQQIAAALQEAHDQNMLMEGIRPEHILLGHNNELLVSGFEVIFRERTTPDETHTAQYTAPEQQAGTHLAASDQYALGIMVYEWLSGRQLSQVETLSNTSLPSLDTLVPELPPKVNEVVMQALAKDPKQRFTGVEDFANALEEASTLQSKSNTSSYVGQEFGRYRIVKLLGRGGFADVYVGKHVDMQTFAAIKILDVRMVHEHAQNFLKEARIIAGLNHPNIVRVLDFGIKSDLPFLVMDQAKQALRDIHPKGSVLTPSSILPYLKQVASALHYAHNQRVLHRDVKPENILLGFRNQVLLSDFGLATLMGQSNVHHTQRIVGTAKYMAPEQFKMEVSPASDQYSLGIVVYEWLTSEPPFTEGGFAQLMYQHLELAPPSIREKVPTLSPDIERVVMIALAKDPKQRFGSILAFANAFEQACR